MESSTSFNTPPLIRQDLINDDTNNRKHVSRSTKGRRRFGSTRWMMIMTLMIGLVVGGFVTQQIATFPDRLSGRRKLISQNASTGEPTRILYIVTALNEYNSGTRNTEKGSDRLQLTLIPVVSEGIRSMVKAGYHVDLYLICHFTLLPEREALIRRALPDSVGLQIWNDAAPLAYDTGQKPFTRLRYDILHLARQHRFVIKDKLLDYDVFVNFEDDMLITAEHVRHFANVTHELERLYEQAPDDPPSTIVSHQDAVQSYHGVMTKGQLRRTIPGFIRVEVLLDETNYPAQTDTGPVPVDLQFTNKSDAPQQVNPTICCHVHSETTGPHIPAAPTADQLMLWETNIFALGVRKMPHDSWLQWVMTQRGPSQNNLNISDVIGDYWSNRNNDYWPKTNRPKPLEFKYINNQGGWMATRDQLWRWHTDICAGGFLPPYEAPHYRFDGLDMRNVEWYSGGMQLSTVRHACNMQRIISLDPEGFSRSLIYHTANNKQRQLASKSESSFVKANTLLGQLNTIKKHAEKELASL